MPFKPSSKPSTFSGSNVKSEVYPEATPNIPLLENPPDFQPSL